MTNDAEAVSAASAVRAAVDLDRLPWIRPLVAAYTRRFASVAPLFAGNPADPSAWRDTIARVQQAGGRDRDALAEILTSQLDARGAPPEARAAARALALPATVAVVTGQQAGLFGGPLYTLLKAVSAVQLAARLAAEHRVTVVPVFWVEGDDHDWAEVRSTQVLDADAALCTIEMPDLDGAGQRPVGSLRLDDRVGGVIAMLEAALPATEFSPEIFGALRRAYAPGVDMAQACARWLDGLLGGEGLVIFDAADARAKRLAGDLFVRELREGGLVGRLAREAGARMREHGHQPQVESAEASVGLFYLGDGARRAIRRADDAFVVGDERRAPAALAAEAESHPERFSPNVLLRPLVQDRLFPTIGYIAGPSELAYQAQLGGAYRAFDVPAPLLWPRVSATLLDAGAVRFLDRSSMPFEALQAQDEAALNALLERQLPPGLDASLETLDRQVAERLREIRETVALVDPTLAGAADTTLTRIREAVKGLQGKVVQAAKRKDDTVRRQFHRTRALAFPGGSPQERTLGLAFFANRYGPSIGRRLIDALPSDPSQHYVLVL
jgi:bacillithiol biosynthesis cysteine-adding enzyme BshC